MKLTRTRSASTGDSLDVITNCLKSGDSIPLSWVVAWSRNGADPVESAWHESASPQNMLTLVIVCGRWNARLNNIFGESPADFPVHHVTQPWQATDTLVRREVDAIEVRMRERDSSYWKTPGGNFFSVSARVQLETAIAERLLANKIHRAVSPPTTAGVMACIRNMKTCVR